MMGRLRQRDLKTYYVKPATTVTGTAGGKKTVFSETSVTIQAKIQPAGGKAAAEQYGERLGYILKMYYDGSTSIKEGDGICVNVSSSEGPDYKVVARYLWADVVSFDLEKVI